MRWASAPIGAACTACVAMSVGLVPAQPTGRTAVDTTTLRGKVMCGYQGWFRCPGDASGMGWMHWSSDRARIAPETLTFEMWPDVSDYSPEELCAASGFTHPDGSQAYLFSSDNAATVLRHFESMRGYGIDGAWLQRFVVGLPGGPEERWYESTLHVLGHARRAARATGRAWALSYDTAAMPPEQILEAVIADWKRLVDAGVVADDRYMHEGGRPVVQVWGFYPGDARNRITARTGHQLADFFATPGPYQAFLVGGGTWTWREIEDPGWRSLYRRFDAYCPWNVGNYSLDAEGGKHAATHYWADDLRECLKHEVLWLPVVYPGFSWDNLTRQPPGSSEIPRRRGMFLWEQFRELAELGVDSAYIAMLDEVDEGTAVFEVTSAPPTQAHFVGYDGLPADWYLRLVGEGARMLRGERPVSADIPIQP